MGCGVWGFTGFEVANYLIFREKVPKFSPRSLPGPELFDFKKA
ncbi:type IV pilin PilA [Microcystis sp. 0824]|nr:type IV pilin PilA [Microcystis sp. 0824]